ncbi:hypothetical protein [Fortiea contorta]|uniref:hypothetical protein n=1 Tax=Fortiea contorta TaxID=1892405 RepID=UPI001EE67861|nr:hypothetical protein [Fortiea contorta]
MLTSITALIGGIYWYGNNEKKKYGLERDFGHIRRNQEQMQQGIDLIIKEIDFRFDSINKDVIEIKSVLRMPKD